MKNKKRNYGKLLTEALTTDQAATLLDVIFSNRDMSQLMDKFEAADPDMAGAVDKILHLDDEALFSPGKKIVSERQVIEQWRSLWDRWDKIVNEVGDEDGAYAYQENSWEEPYFDGYQLAEDLEKIAGQMMEMVEDVYVLSDDENPFINAMEEIDANTGLYPEWMGVEHGEPCELEQYVTHCTLKWMWLSAQEEAEPVKSLLHSLLEIDNSFDMVKLKSSECIQFIMKLPEDLGRDIYDCLKAEPGQFSIEKKYSKWQAIYHHVQHKFDNKGYLDTCLQNLNSDWQYGQPLVKKAMQEKDYTKTESLLKQTFASFLDLKKGDAWLPESDLLLTLRRHYFTTNTEGICNLLDIWTEVADNTGEQQRKAASIFQRIAFHTPDDWKAVIEKYKELQKSGGQKVPDHLFNQWTDEMVWRSALHRYSESTDSDTWVHWLIKAYKEEEKTVFIKNLKQWLAGVKKNPSAFKKEWEWLTVLTGDMPESSTLVNDCPAFFNTVLPKKNEASLLETSRCSLLQGMKADACFPDVMAVWKTHLNLVIPSPSDVHKADYTRHAKWMKALHELNQTAYGHKLEKWKEKHHRRRNLWRDMEAAGLPV